MNPYLLLGALVVWGLSLFAVGKYEYGVGVEHERVSWQAKENAQLAAANATTARFRKKEQDAAAAIAALGEAHASNLEALEVRRRADVAAARSGALKLRIPASFCPDRGGVPDPAAPATGSNETQTVELPRDIGADLYALADDADEVATILGACQATIRLYRGTS